MLLPFSSDSFGSITPLLEGAPRSQSHDLRIGTAQSPLISDIPVSPEEKGAEHEASADASS